eukprot:5760-Pyramimonas_sp.AAC.1
MEHLIGVPIGDQHAGKVERVAQQVLKILSAANHRDVVQLVVLGGAHGAVRQSDSQTVRQSDSQTVR